MCVGVVVIIWFWFLFGLLNFVCFARIPCVSINALRSIPNYPFWHKMYENITSIKKPFWHVCVTLWRNLTRIDFHLHAFLTLYLCFRFFGSNQIKPDQQPNVEQPTNQTPKQSCKKHQLQAGWVYVDEGDDLIPYTRIEERNGKVLTQLIGFPKAKCLSSISTKLKWTKRSFWCFVLILCIEVFS